MILGANARENVRKMVGNIVKEMAKEMAREIVPGSSGSALLHFLMVLY